MALDKVIDSAKLDADLTSIADAIREKAGVSDSFVFPDGFVEAVSGISAGGGDSGLNLLHSSFSPAETTVYLTINHGLGRVPQIIILAAKNASHNIGGSSDLYFLLGVYFYGTYVASYTNYAGTSSRTAKTRFVEQVDITTSADTYVYFRNANDETFEYAGSAAQSRLKAGQEYLLWVG